MKIFHLIIPSATGLVLAAALLCCWNYTFADQPKGRIAVVTSHDAAPYQEALEGFKRYLSSQGTQLSFDVYALEGDGAKANQALEKVKKEGARVVFTLGSIATRAAINNGELPTVAGLILDKDEIKKSANVTGVVLDFPLEIQFEWMHKILPGCKSIGVIHNPKNLEKIRAAEKVAQNTGLKIYSKQVETPSDIPDALEYLSRHVDALWGIVDDLVFTSQTAKEILLVSFRNRIPLIGISSAWVKAGALYSLDWDYADMGSQCGEMALKILQGTKPGNIPAAWPRKIVYSLNPKTALHMKIDFPESLIQGAHQVFK